MQECLYWTPVLQYQRLETAPHWHMGKRVNRWTNRDSGYVRARRWKYIML